MKVHCVSGIGLDSNVYIIEAKKTAIVDSGTGLYTKAVLDKVRSLGLEKKVAALVLTHRHVDHSGGAHSIAKALGCRVLSSETEATVLRQENEPSTCSYMAGIDLPALDVDDIGDILDLGDAKLKARVAPGHTDGH